VVSRTHRRSYYADAPATSTNWSLDHLSVAIEVSLARRYGGSKLQLYRN
jgi:hypothetical protein